MTTHGLRGNVALFGLYPFGDTDELCEPRDNAAAFEVRLVRVRARCRRFLRQARHLVTPFPQRRYPTGARPPTGHHTDRSVTAAKGAKIVEIPMLSMGRYNFAV